MENLHQLLKDYQRLLAQSQKIKGLALAEKWDDLVEQEVAYVQLVEQLSKSPIPTNTESVMRLQFRQVLQDILDTEAEIKTLLEARMVELSNLMKQSKTQKSLGNTYSEFASHSRNQTPVKPRS